MRGAREHHRPKEREPTPGARERHQAFVRAVDAHPQLLEPARDATAAPAQGRRRPSYDVRNRAREDHHHDHHDAEDAEDRETGTEQGVVSDPQRHLVLGERLARPEIDGHGTGDREEGHGGDEGHEGGGHRLREAHARALHGVHHHRSRSALERGQVSAPRAHPARDDHVAHPHARVHVPRHHPQARTAADPVHGGEPQPNQQPSPAEVQQGRDHRLQVVAIDEQHDDHADEGDEREQLQPAAEQPRREGQGHGGPKYGGQVPGARCPAQVWEAPIPTPTPGTGHPRPVNLEGYARASRSRRVAQRAPAQSQRHYRRDPAACPHGGHWTLRLRQKLAGLRYPLRRGPAALHRVALHLRQAVPGADAQAAPRCPGGALPGRGDRAEESHDVEPVDRRHRDGDLRLSAPAVGARGDALLPDLRRGREGGHGAGRGGRPARRSAGRRAARDVSIAGERPPAGGGRGGAAAGGGVRARAGERRRPAPRRRRGRASGAGGGRSAGGGGSARGGRRPPRPPRPRGPHPGRPGRRGEPARAKGIPFARPWRDLTEKQRHALLHGVSGRYVGIFPFLERLEEKRYKQYIRVFLRQYQLAKTCPACGGARLKPEALSVRLGSRTIAEAAALTAAELREWLGQLALGPVQQRVAEHVLGELAARVGLVNDVGLGYLTLDRQTRTLSGGEAQRIALSNALGSHLVDTLYVLDEPSIGLHPADIDRLLGLLRRLADVGNTVVVVEHDAAAMRCADWMVELGPGSGEAGGQVVYQGPAAGVREAGTLTGQYLSGEKRIGVPSARRPAARWLGVKGARLHNLRDVDVRVPLGTLTAVTGVSGSGKSTLVHDVLYRQLEARLRGTHSAKQHLGEPVGEVRSLEGWEALADVVLVDQSPIGRTPRSNPITYVKAFDELRGLFAAAPLARERRYSASTFSFNVAGGRCEACEGAGHVLVEMVFLANVFVPCDVCQGKRFKPEVLEVKLDGSSIHDVLDWTVDHALQRFHRHPRLARALWLLQQVGLGYLRLGQPATTLSGGEAPRLKIARAPAPAGARARGGGGRRDRRARPRPLPGRPVMPPPPPPPPPRPPLRVLIVEDSTADAELMLRALGQAGFDPSHERVESADAMRAALVRQPWDVVLSDYTMPGFDAPAALAVLQAHGSDAPFIVVSGSVGGGTAVAAMRAGATDYIMKDRLQRLRAPVPRAGPGAGVGRGRRRPEAPLLRGAEMDCVG